MSEGGKGEKDGLDVEQVPKKGKRKASGDANCAMDEWRRPFREAFSRSKEEW